MSRAGFKYRWKVRPGTRRWRSSTHPISMIRWPSDGSRPLVSVSITICRSGFKYSSISHGAGYGHHARPSAVAIKSAVFARDLRHLRRRGTSLCLFRTAWRHRIDRLVGEPVDPLVAGHTGVARHPVPLDGMTGRELIEPLPQILILHGLAVCGEPAPRLPCAHPFPDAAPDILRVGIHPHASGTLQRLERTDDRRQLHAVVGGQRLRARKLLLAAGKAEQGRPAARPRITAAGAIGIDVYPAAGCVVL